MKRNLFASFVLTVVFACFGISLSGCGEKYPSEPINEKRGAGTADDEEEFEGAEPEFRR